MGGFAKVNKALAQFMLRFEQENALMIEPVDTVKLFGKNHLLHNMYLLTFPAVFFCLRHQTNTKQTLIAGLLAGPIAVMPGIFFYLSMLSDYPAILTSGVHSTTLLNNLNITWLYLAFGIVLFATLIETGVGLIHAFNERISIFYQEKNKKMPRMQRSIIAMLCLSISMGMAQFGLVELISKGYGLLIWLILCIFVVPLVFFSVRDFIKINVMRNAKVAQNISSLESIHSPLCSYFHTVNPPKT